MDRLPAHVGCHNHVLLTTRVAGGNRLGRGMCDGFGSTDEGFSAYHLLNTVGLWETLEWGKSWVDKWIDYNMGKYNFLTFSIPGTFPLAPISCLLRWKKHLNTRLFTSWWYVDGLVQNCSISSASALEILSSCTKPSIEWEIYTSEYSRSSKVVNMRSLIGSVNREFLMFPHPYFMSNGINAGLESPCSSCCFVLHSLHCIQQRFHITYHDLKTKERVNILPTMHIIVVMQMVWKWKSWEI